MATNPKSVGNTYWHVIQYPHGLRVPAINRTTTTEVDPPFRHGPCLVLGVPFTNSGIVIGRWTETLDETDAISLALGLRVIDDNGLGFEDSLV